MKTDSTDRTLMTRGLLRIDEAADYAAIGRTVAYRLIGRGDWPTVMIGRSRRVPLEDLDAWIRANKRTAASPVPDVEASEPAAQYPLAGPTPQGRANAASTVPTTGPGVGR